MYDSLYFETRKDYLETKQQILTQFPNAIIEDASDDIHDHRYSVQLLDAENYNFYKFILQEGFGLCSLHVNIMCGSQEKEHKEMLNKILDEIKDEKIKQAEGICYLK